LQALIATAVSWQFSRPRTESPLRVDFVEKGLLKP
jgi:hypothetical protein